MTRENKLQQYLLYNVQKVSLASWLLLTVGKCLKKDSSLQKILLPASAHFCIKGESENTDAGLKTLNSLQSLKGQLCKNEGLSPPSLGWLLMLLGAALHPEKKRRDFP